MNLADVFTVTFIILGFFVVFIGYWLTAAGLFPGLVERCADRIGRTPIKAGLLGAVTMVPLVGIGLAISSKAPNAAGKVAGLAIALLTLFAALIGSAGIALRIGQGLKSVRDEHEPWRRVLRGGIALGLSFILPVLGTFIVMPLTFIVGFGGFLLSRGKRQVAPARALEPAPLSVQSAVASAS